MVVFSDGSFMQCGYIPSEIFISDKLQEGSIVQLTKFGTIDLHNRKGEINIKSMMMEKNKENDVGACFKKLETSEDVSKLTRMMMEKNKEDDMGAYIEKLDKLGWGAEDPLYDTALLLFGQSADYTKLWLHLKPESCGKWVKNAGKSVLSRRENVGDTLEQILNIEGHAWKHNCVDSMG
nr:L10-interacting MYB domain-containing protein-like [Tanacetum cinerariifolium]